MRGITPPHARCWDTAGNRLILFILLLYFVLECTRNAFFLPLPICLCSCLSLTHTQSAQTSVLAGSSSCWPLQSPYFPGCHFMLHPTFWADLRPGPAGRVPSFGHWNLCQGGGAQLPGQPSSFLTRNLMPLSLESTARVQVPSSVCVWGGLMASRRPLSWWVGCALRISPRCPCSGGF